MMQRHNTGFAAFLAAMTAGPVFIIMLGLGAVANGGTDPFLLDDLGDTIASGALMALVSVPFGLVIAIVPALLGTACMAWLSRANSVAQLPIVWALAGGLIAYAGSGWLIELPEGIFALSGTAAVVALMARHAIGYRREAPATPIEISACAAK